MGEYGTTFNTAVAAQLRAERAAAKLTIDQLAKRSGLVRGTLLRYLNDQREIPVPAFIEISLALNIEPQVIIDRAQDRLSQE